jgi:CRISPR-associated protein Cas8a1/Csx13
LNMTRLGGEDMQSNKLRIGLFDPGITHLHRVGLAGLYMSLKRRLKRLDPSHFSQFGGWVLDGQSVEIHWKLDPRSLLEPIIADCFGIKKGIIDFLIHRGTSMGSLEKVLFHKAILQTYLQHGRTRKNEKTEKVINFPFEDKTIIQKIKPLTAYSHQSIDKLGLFDKNGGFKENMKLANWLFPGGTVRHVGYNANTALYADPKSFLCLLFAPVGSLYYLLSHRNVLGKYDRRKGTAIVFPHITDLEVYDRCYTRYLTSPIQRLYADSLGDAGLMALTALNLFAPSGMVAELEVDGCTVVTMGTVGWSKQQKTRTGLMRLLEIDKQRLNVFNLVLRCLTSTAHVKKDGVFYVWTSLSRGLIANNIAQNKEWFDGFCTLMFSKELARMVSFERKGLKDMAENAIWTYESDRLFVESIHNAIRNRYGALAARAKQRGEKVRFDREFEKIRTSLVRSKNAQTLRAGLADMFARGGINKSLQEHWAKLLPLFTGPNWEKARDLALLALASYSGKGTEEIEKVIPGEEEVE